MGTIHSNTFELYNNNKKSHNIHYQKLNLASKHKKTKHQ